MLVAAGFIISNVSSNPVVAAIGLALGRGTLTSIALVLLALPQTLLMGDIIIEKTAFTLKREITRQLPASGKVRVNGHVKGMINGVVDGEFSGIIEGEMGAVIRARDKMERLDEELSVIPEGSLKETADIVADEEIVSKESSVQSTDTLPKTEDMQEEGGEEA